eukprot:scaffold519_cov331-Pavlova_lutheri.AAC.40
MLPFVQHRLRAYDARSADVFGFTILVDDGPVSVHELHWFVLSNIGDSDFVQVAEPLVPWRGSFRHWETLDGDAYAVGGLVAGRICSQFFQHAEPSVDECEGGKSTVQSRTDLFEALAQHGGFFTKPTPYERDHIASFLFALEEGSSQARDVQIMQIFQCQHVLGTVTHGLLLQSLRRTQQTAVERARHRRFGHGNVRIRSHAKVTTTSVGYVPSLGFSCLGRIPDGTYGPRRTDPCGWKRSPIHGMDPG